MKFMRENSKMIKLMESENIIDGMVLKLKENGLKIDYTKHFDLYMFKSIFCLYFIYYESRLFIRKL